MNDQSKVNAALARLVGQRADAEADEYTFFFQATPLVQAEYYQYWCNVHATHDKPMPRFLVDYEKAHKLSQKS